ncbi:MAG: hypothetical protein JWP44_2111 [Mucilaginibacter sp.]|nr:hypothetical protein [Mucilaginibacter sp.]
MELLPGDKGHFYAGTSNVVLPVPNKSMFPPHFRDKSRLTYYASLFNSVEVNSSFYKIPRGVTLEKWTTEVPDDFRFTFKLWQGITHNKELSFNPETIAHFVKTISAVGKKKGCLLVQFPPAFSFNFTRLENLLQYLQQENTHYSWRIAVEFRNRTWYQDIIYQLLEHYRMGMVIHDLPASATPLLEAGSDFVYLRFHGPEGGYRGSYTDDFLAEYASYIREWQTDEKTVYVYFNNTMGEAVKNLATLNSFIKE